ncbi:MAG: DUF2157 domain-containing protein [Flavobacterium sp.]
MKQEEIIPQLVEKELITSDQFEEVKNYRVLGVFSLHNELLFLLYLSVLLFTTGIGTLIYKNIDSIGHGFVLALLFLMTIACFYFSFKKAKGFSREDVDFENPVYNYLVLTATILSCIFVGYLQFQYQIFGNNYSWATLFSAMISFGVAYYFNNKSALSIAITGLVTTIGISLTPKDLLENEIYSNPMLSYSGLVLGVLLLVWDHYSKTINLKKHFSLVFLTFALHLISICCIAGLLEDYWFMFVFVMAGFTYYFYKISYEIKAISIFTFTILYSYIGFNITLFKLFDLVDLNFFGEFFIILTPFYFIGSIVGFIQLIKHFNKKSHDSIQ